MTISWGVHSVPDHPLDEKPFPNIHLKHSLWPCLHWGQHWLQPCPLPSQEATSQGRCHNRCAHLSTVFPTAAWLIQLTVIPPHIPTAPRVWVPGDGCVIDGVLVIWHKRSLSAPCRWLHIAPRVYSITVTWLAFFFSPPCLVFPTRKSISPAGFVDLGKVSRAKVVIHKCGWAQGSWSRCFPWQGAGS